MAAIDIPPGWFTAKPLLAALSCSGHRHLIIGSGPLAAARCGRSIAAGAWPVVVTDDVDKPLNELAGGIAERAKSGSITLLQRRFSVDDVTTLGRPEVDGIVDAVFLATTIGACHSNKELSAAPCRPSGSETSTATADQLAAVCARHRVPVNIVDRPDLTSFALLAEHTDGPIRVGITTSGRGCRLAGRIRREIAAVLPRGLGRGVDLLAAARQGSPDGLDGPDDAGLVDGRLGKPVMQNGPETDDDEASRRRIWVAQVSEYWPLARIATLTRADVEAVLTTGAAQPGSPDAVDHRLHDDGPTDWQSRPHVALAGSGPGNPGLLTVSTAAALRSYPVVVTDKLVPGPILALIPPTTTVHIARKFPGHADAGQAELQKISEQALAQGQSVLRLKQGDPFVFGRGGEEAVWFTGRGWPVRILPGLSAATSATACAHLALTQRGLADRVVVRTGTGEAGVGADVDGFDGRRTDVWLMALHRLDQLVAGMQSASPPYPLTTPCAVIERASCPDQRVVVSTLADIVDAVAETGGRPPGLFVVGQVCGQSWARSGGQSGADDGRGGRWTVSEGWLDAPAGQELGRVLESLGSEKATDGPISG